MDIDAQLLDRYARTRDADAFIQLVRRHAGMVFSVARRVTRDHHDAEDVAQSCFMELARHPDAIHGSLAGWLHTVATTRAADCNRAAGRRRHHERSATRPEAPTQGEWEEFAPLVDAALAELPEGLRVPVVLYYLEGRTLREIAAELGIGSSTVWRRVEAGVAALREKLQAAGVMAPSVALPALLAQHAIVAVPKPLMVMLGKVAVSGFVPGLSGAAVSGAAASGTSGTSGGAAAVSGASSSVAKGTAVLGAKVLAAVIVTAAVTTAGVALLLPKQQAVVAVTTQTGNEADGFISRLKAEIAQGLGDGTGVLTETWVHQNPKTKAERSIPAVLTLYGQYGHSRLYMEYITQHASPPRSANKQVPADKMPDDWPAPSIDNVLRFANEVQTAALGVTDGHTTWYGDWAKGGHEPMTMKLISAPNDQDRSSGHRVDPAARAFWPDPQLLTVRSSGSGSRVLQSIDMARGLQSVELVRRSDAPALVGIRFTSAWDREGGKSITTFWLDPSRNDVPVEQDWLLMTKAGRTTLFRKTEFIEYAQLPDGRWYPTHWRMGNADSRLGGFSHYDYRLTFAPERSLDAGWFGDPTAHFLAGIEAPPGLFAPAQGVVAHAQVLIASARKMLTRSIWTWVPWAMTVMAFGAAAVLALLRPRKQMPALALRGAQDFRRR